MDKILASFIDKFKTANPRIFGIIAVIFFIIKYAIEQGSAFGLFQITGDFKTAMDWITWVVALMMGSRTYNVLNETKTPDAEPMDVLSQDLWSQIMTLKNENDVLLKQKAELESKLDISSDKMLELNETIEALESKYSALLEEVSAPQIPVTEIKPFLPPKKRKKKDIL